LKIFDPARRLPRAGFFVSAIPHHTETPMPDIILPKRVPALLTRRRSVDASTAADVPTVNPAVARDPGLNVPSGAFGGGIGEGLESFGDALSSVADDLKKAEERKKLAEALEREKKRQKKLTDATEGTKIRGAVLTRLRDGLASPQSQTAFADDAARRTFNSFVDTTIADAKTQSRDLTGVSRIFRDRRDTLFLQGVQQRGIEQLTLLIDETASRVRSDVAVAPIGDAHRFLLGELDVFDGTVTEFTGAFEQDRERPIIAGRTGTGPGSPGTVGQPGDRRASGPGGPGPSEEQHRGADRGP
jgi:hypothetical protein